MAYIVMAYIVMAYSVMAYTVMAYIVMNETGTSLTRSTSPYGRRVRARVRVNSVRACVCACVAACLRATHACGAMRWRALCAVAVPWRYVAMRSNADEIRRNQRCGWRRRVAQRVMVGGRVWPGWVGGLNRVPCLPRSPSTWVRRGTDVGAPSCQPFVFGASA